ncbi:MAG: hypothetical protein HC805_08480 [Alkalinema sp. RL_2_19]|nr:hypothetical protein [Alkalinema sp. RL_2_19]
MLLLDPAEVNIGSSTTNDAELDGDNQILTGDGGVGIFAISADKIEGLLEAGTDVAISASSRINLTTNGRIRTTTGTGGLSLSAPEIDFSVAGQAIDLSGGDLTLNYTSNNPITINRELLTGGDLVINAGGSLNVNQRLRSGGDLQLQAAAITLGSSLFVSGDINLQAQSILVNDTAQLETLTRDVNLNATNALTIVDNSQILAARNLNLISQGSLLSLNSRLQAQQALTLQAQTGLNLISSTVQGGANLNMTAVAGDVAIRGTTVAAAQDLTVQANQAINISETIVPDRAVILQSGGAMQLTGRSNINIQALAQPQSVLRSSGDLTLTSDGAVTGNGRFLSGGNFVTQTLGGGTGNFIYNPQSSNGIVSAIGNVSFNDYTGKSLKVEAGGSIQTGNINITTADTALQGTDADIATLSTSPALVLRAGVTGVGQTVNQLPAATDRRNNPNLPAGFSSNGTSSAPASITTGNITIENTVAGADAVVLAAPGDITTGTIVTEGGNVKLAAQTGNITVETINTRPAGQGGGSVALTTDGLVRVTDTFDFTYQDPFPAFTTSATSILTSSGGVGLDGKTLPGSVRIRSGATEFVENYQTNPLAETRQWQRRTDSPGQWE